MAQDRFSLFGKIFIATVILIIPLIVIASIDPVAQRFGICTKDICIPEGVDILNSCTLTDRSKVCAYDLNSVNQPITLLETDTFWRITGFQVVCQERGIYEDTRTCFDIVEFNKLVWQWTLRMEEGGKDIRIFTVIGDKTLEEQERSIFG